MSRVVCWFKKRRMDESINMEIMISGHEAHQQVAMSREVFQRHQFEIKRLQIEVAKLGGPYLSSFPMDPSPFDPKFKETSPSVKKGQL